MGFTLQNASMVWEKGHFKHFFSMGKRRNYSNAKKNDVFKVHFAALLSLQCVARATGLPTTYSMWSPALGGKTA